MRGIIMLKMSAEVMYSSPIFQLRANRGIAFHHLFLNASAHQLDQPEKTIAQFEREKSNIYDPIVILTNSFGDFHLFLFKQLVYVKKKEKKKMDVLQRWLQKELTFLKGTLFALTLTHTQFFYFNTFRVNASFDFDK